MNHYLPTETKPADCWDWLTPDDALRVALASFYGACRISEMEIDGEPWRAADGTTNASRHTFAAEIIEQFKCRLYDLAHQKRVGNYLQFVRENHRIENAISKRRWPEYPKHAKIDTRT